MSEANHGALNRLDVFQERLRIGVALMMLIYLVLVVVNFCGGVVGQGTIVFNLVNLLLLVSMIVAFFTIKDKFFFLLVTHPIWLFSVSAYLYSALVFKPVEEYLYAPDFSMLMVLTYQTACYTAALVVAVFRTRLAPRGRIDSIPFDVAIAPIVFPMMIAGLTSLVLGFVGGGAVGVKSLTSTFSILYWVGLAIYISRSNIKTLFDPIIFISFAIAGSLSVLSNQRTVLFQLVFFLILAALYYMRKIATPSKIIAGYFILTTFFAFSDATILVRLDGGRVSMSRTIELYEKYFFSVDGLEKILLPLHSDAADQFVRKSFSDGFKIRYLEGGNTLATRFVLLPQMDIVVPYLSRKVDFNKSDLKSLFLNILPSIGQTKDLVLGDRITWDAELRNEGNIGMPMITSVAEFFALGGFPVLFGLSLLLFVIYFSSYFYFQYRFDNYVVLVLLFSQLMIDVLITTTALSVTATIMRGIPFIILMFIMLRYLAMTFVPRPRVSTGDLSPTAV